MFRLRYLLFAMLAAPAFGGEIFLTASLECKHEEFCSVTKTWDVDLSRYKITWLSIDANAHFDYWYHLQNFTDSSQDFRMSAEMSGFTSFAGAEASCSDAGSYGDTVAGGGTGTGQFSLLCSTGRTGSVKDPTSATFVLEFSAFRENDLGKLTVVQGDWYMTANARLRAALTEIPEPATAAFAGLLIPVVVTHAKRRLRS